MQSSYLSKSEGAPIKTAQGFLSVNTQDKHGCANATLRVLTVQTAGWAAEFTEQVGTVRSSNVSKPFKATLRVRHELLALPAVVVATTYDRSCWLGYCDCSDILERGSHERGYVGRRSSAALVAHIPEGFARAVPQICSALHGDA